MNTNKAIKKTVIFSLIWKVLERGGTQGIQFLVQIILARLLIPEDYGLISLVMIFIMLANLFVQRGFNTALIQKNNVDEVDFSSVFYLSLFVSGILYMILFTTSPFIANFYQEIKIKSILRVLSINLFFGAYNSILNAFLVRNMMFKKLFFCSLGSILISGTLGILTAYLGFGIWALVVQQLINELMITVILSFVVKWRPKLLFSFKKVKILFSYGSKLLLSALIDTLYVNSRTLIIGKIFNSNTLAFYNRGEQFPAFIINNVNGSISSVMLPTMASQQDNRERVKTIVRRSITISSFVIFPMMVGLAIISEPLVKIVLTDKWLPAVPYLQIACAGYALHPLHTANLQAVNALGRSDITLRLEVIKKIIGIAILVISIPFGVYAIAWGALVSGIISSFVNAYPNLKLLNYSYIEQWKDIISSLILALIMGLIIYPIKYINMPVLIVMLLQIFIGVLTYVILALIFKNKSFFYLLETVKEIINSK